jgi:hypothetical protein
LPKDFSGKNERSSPLVHLFAGLFKHQSMAVDTRIQVATISVTRRYKHLKMFIGNVHDVKVKADVSSGGQRFVSAEKGGGESKAGDIDILFLNQFNGQNAVKAAREKGNRFDS